MNSIITNRLTQSIGVLILWGLLWPQEAKTQVAAADWPSKARVDSAIALSKTYFSRYAVPVDSLAPDFLVIFLDAFKKHFGFDIQLAALHELRLRGLAPTNLYIKLYPGVAYGNRIDPFRLPYAQLRAQFMATLDEMDTRTQWAMMCDSMALPAVFLDTLWHFARQGGYELTHVGLQLRAILDNGCWSQQNPAVAELYTYCLDSIVHAYDNPPYVSDAGQNADFRCECAAILYYMQAPERVRPDMLWYILNSQQPDGSWHGATSNHLDIGHTSILGLWVLLSYRQTLD